MSRRRRRPAGLRIATFQKKWTLFIVCALLCLHAVWLLLFHQHQAHHGPNDNDNDIKEDEHNPHAFHNWWRIDRQAARPGEDAISKNEAGSGIAIDEQRRGQPPYDQTELLCQSVQSQGSFTVNNSELAARNSSQVNELYLFQFDDPVVALQPTIYQPEVVMEVSVTSPPFSIAPNNTVPILQVDIVLADYRGAFDRQVNCTTTAITSSATAAAATCQAFWILPWQGALPRWMVVRQQPPGTPNTTTKVWVRYASPIRNASPCPFQKMQQSATRNNDANQLVTTSTKQYHQFESAIVYPRRLPYLRH